MMMMDRHLWSTLALIVLLSPISVHSDTETHFCPEPQKAFMGSCYEFVSMQNSFPDAQNRCERDGGHLVFIWNEAVQQFLEKHLSSEHNWWLGLASSSFSRDAGSVLWLNGSEVSYHNWRNEPELGGGCGYIDGEFQWRTTRNCSQEFNFICQFEVGQTLACVDHSAVLQCGSAQVLEVEESFYGRSTEHYCRDHYSLPRTSSQRECSWVDVKAIVSEHCDGLERCEMVAREKVFGEPCQLLGSYLSIKYRCRDEKRGGKASQKDRLVRNKRNIGGCWPGGNCQGGCWPGANFQSGCWPGENWPEINCQGGGGPGGGGSGGPSTAPSSYTSSSQQLTCDYKTSRGIVPLISVTCTENTDFCFNAPCSYCVKTSDGSYVYCGGKQGMRHLYLRQGSSSLIVTMKNAYGETVGTSINVTVANTLDVTSYGVLNLLSQIIRQQPSAPVAAQLFQILADALNSGSSCEALRMKLREIMLTLLCEALSTGDELHYMDEISMFSSAVLSLIDLQGEISAKAETEAACVLLRISKAQVNLETSNTYPTEEIVKIATPIVKASSILLNHTSNTTQQSATVDVLLRVLDNVQNAMLYNKSLDLEPEVIQTPLINVYVNRVLPNDLQNLSQITVENATSAAFTLPSEISNIPPADEPVDVRMLSFNTNPFSWSKGDDIIGVVGGLSLTSTNGSVIPVKNLSQEIEILLPRLTDLNVSSTFLDLSRYSTLAIDFTSPGKSLVLKFDPVEDTPLMLYLGFQYHPTDITYIAKAQLPQNGSSREERYTWVVNFEEVKLDIGVYYLLVKPIVDAGGNSQNASVIIHTVAAHCKFWVSSTGNWTDDGCRVGPYTSSGVTQCLCNHLTFFGNSFFVIPNTVDDSGAQGGGGGNP